MQIIEGTKEFKLEGPSAAAIGKFDGIHRGHRELLDSIVERRARGLKAVALTFDPAPAFFFGQTGLRELTTREERRDIFHKVGIDVLIEYPFDTATASMLPEAFVREVLVGRMKAAYIVAGTDLSFGDKGKGDCALLQSYAAAGGYEVKIVQKLCHNGREVSSTYVREEVERGNMELVTELIGYPYSVGGRVVHGKQFGRTIGMPTLNLLPPDNKLLPPRGVYLSQVSVDGRHYDGITNIGCKPTVSEEKVMGVETYLYDFSGDLYGEKIRVNLLAYCRPERKFADKEELKAQLEKDIQAGRTFFEKRRY